MKKKLFDQDKLTLVKMSKQEKNSGVQKKPKNRKRRRVKEVGRKRVKRSFDETRIGHLLKHEAPLEYSLIIDAINSSSAPSADFIEAISYSSDNPLFRKVKFRRCLIEFRKYGLYSGRPIKPNASVELYYIKIRKNQQIREFKVR